MFPITLKQEIEKLLQGQKVSSLAGDYARLSLRYRGEKGGSSSLLKNEKEALSYAAVRMPATYGAVWAALEKVLEVTDLAPKTMLDVGAGTGACGWAANELIALEKLTCLEREKVMRSLGQQLMQTAEENVLRQAQWVDFDLLKDDKLPSAELVTASYVLNEMGAASVAVAEKLWQATEQILVIIEPGTPRDFSALLAIRDHLIKQGAYVLAPCPHQQKCPLSENDWCHFSARIERSRLHKQLKGADMGYEDEKYCFMAFSRFEPKINYQRILNIPKVQKTEISAQVCTIQGQCEDFTVSIKDKYAYKKAKKWRWGDILA